MMRTPVKQKHPLGCGIACLAMVSGMSYDDVLGTFFSNGEECKGTFQHELEYWLADRGFATSHKWRYRRGNVPAEPWPPTPWTDVHIVQLMVNGKHSHDVVMLKDGSVLDPHFDDVTTLANPRYTEVHSVAGVHKVSQ